MALFIVNCDFDGGSRDEVIEANPVLIQDWIDAQFVSPIDELGNRVIPAPGSE